MRCANCAARPRYDVARRRFSSSVRRMIGSTAKSRSPRDFFFDGDQRLEIQDPHAQSLANFEFMSVRQ
jgi:hypothetical protein